MPADATPPAAGLNRNAVNLQALDLIWQENLRQKANIELFNPGVQTPRIRPVETQYVPDLVRFFTNVPVSPPVPAKFKVGEIKIVGNPQSADDAIRERLGLSPGQTITPAELQQAEKMLQESLIFKQAPSVTVADPPGGAVKDIVITIQNK